MAATDPIGSVQQIYLRSLSAGEIVDTNINGRNITVNYEATYQQVDTAMRAFNNLTTNTYVDTTLITAVSVNSELM